MKKNETIAAFVIIFSLVICIAFVIPKEMLKTAASAEINSNKSNNVSFYQVDSFYEEREEDQNRRVITIYVDNFIEDTEVWMQIFDYANKLPLTWGGFTAVFFFNNRTYTPFLSNFTEEFDVISGQYCVAGYWKYSNGTDIFRQYPFKID